MTAESPSFSALHLSLITSLMYLSLSYYPFSPFILFILGILFCSYFLFVNLQIISTSLIHTLFPLCSVLAVPVYELRKLDT